MNEKRLITVLEECVNDDLYSLFPFLKGVSEGDSLQKAGSIASLCIPPALHCA